MKKSLKVGLNHLTFNRQKDSTNELSIVWLQLGTPLNMVIMIFQWPALTMKSSTLDCTGIQHRYQTWCIGKSPFKYDDFCVSMSNFGGVNVGPFLQGWRARTNLWKLWNLIPYQSHINVVATCETQLGSWPTCMTQTLPIWNHWFGHLFLGSRKFQHKKSTPQGSSNFRP